MSNDESVIYEDSIDNEILVEGIELVEIEPRRAHSFVDRSDTR